MTALLATALPFPAGAQEVQHWGGRLEHRLNEPLVYLSRMGPAAMDPLLNDPVLQQLLSHRSAAGTGADVSRTVLRSVARLLSRNSEDLELALTQMVPTRAGVELPNLIFRCRLDEKSAGVVRKLLEGDLAKPQRKLFEHQVYGLSGDQDSDIEVAMVGQDLMISNDPQALRLAMSPHTTTGRPLSRNQRYKTLRKGVAVPEGAVMLYANWQKLGSRLSSLLDGDGRLPFGWSGLRQTDRVLLVSRPHSERGEVRGFVTTVLLTQRQDRAGRRGSRGARLHLDGWLDLVEAAKPRQLLGGLRNSGSLMSLAVAVDPQNLLPTGEGPRMRSLQGWLFGQSARMGLDVKRQLKRLGKNGGLHVKLLPGEGLLPRVAYSFQARSRKAARDLLQDLSGLLVSRKWAVSRKLETGTPVLEVDSPGFGRYSFGRRRFGGRDSGFLAAIGDALYFTFDRATMVQVDREHRAARRARSRDAKVMQYLRHLGARDKKVAGLFAADLNVVSQRLLAHLDGGSKDGKTKNKTKNKGKPAQVSGLFGMHAGYFTVEPGLIRLEVFSPR